MKGFNIKEIDLIFYKHIYEVVKDVKETYPDLNSTMLIFEDHLTGGAYLTKTSSSPYCEVCGDYDREIGLIDMDTGLEDLERKIQELEELREHLLELNNAPGYARVKNIFNSLGFEWNVNYEKGCLSSKCHIPTFATVEEFNEVIQDDSIPLKCKACGIKDGLYYLE